MKTGLAKQFKQVLDAQVKRADEAGHGIEPGRTGPAGDRPPTRRRRRQAS